MGNCFTMLVGVAVLLTVVLMIFKTPLLNLFGASPDTLPYADSYLEIYLIGTISVQIALGMNQFVSAQGFAKTAMLTVCIGAALNIVLDPIFIFALDMGVRGAALATILSQTVSAVWVLLFISSKRSNLRLRARNFRVSPRSRIRCWRRAFPLHHAEHRKPCAGHLQFLAPELRRRRLRRRRWSS